MCRQRKREQPTLSLGCDVSALELSSLPGDDHNRGAVGGTRKRGTRRTNMRERGEGQGEEKKERWFDYTAFRNNNHQLDQTGGFA